MSFVTILGIGICIPIAILSVIMVILKIILARTASHYVNIAEKRVEDFETKKLKILDYNAFWRPTMLHMGRKEWMRLRSKLLLEKIESYDVVCLEEGFQFGSDIAKNFIEGAKSLGFKYVLTSKLPPIYTHQVIDSGLIILSKFPIIESDTIRYTVFCGVDSFAAKGSIYAKIQLDSKNHVHLFSTHLQASYQNGQEPTVVDVLVRQKQFDQLSAFMATKVTDGYPAVLVGDLNVNSRLGDEYKSLLDHLKIPEYSCVDTLLTTHGEHPVTCGGDDDKVLPEPGDVGTHQSLDYIYLFEKHDKPQLKVSYKPEVNKMLVNGQKFFQLSDHFAVECEFEFN